MQVQDQPRLLQSKSEVIPSIVVRTVSKLNKQNQKKRIQAGNKVQQVKAKAIVSKPKPEFKPPVPIWWK